MKAVLIDAVAKTVTEVEYDGELETVYALLRCELIDAVNSGGGSVTLVDDEGLLNAESDDSPFIVFTRDGSVIAGSALVVGDADEDGDTTECPYDAETIAENVAFATRRELREQYGIDPQPHIGFYPL